MAFVTAISPQEQRELEDRFNHLGIKPHDIQEHFVRSSGPGGQKLNKTASCVVLRHIPTGLEVKCQTTRSQATNRFLARRRLIEKIEACLFKKKSEAQKLKEKIRRQKRRRSRRAQEKRLNEKKGVSEKKKTRQKVSTFFEY